MTTDALSRQYERLSGTERFALIVDAMARGDEVEEGRLDDSCPRVTCIVDDPQYRERLQFSMKFAMSVCLQISGPLTRIHMADVLAKHGRLLSPCTADILKIIFLHARAYGHWEAGAIEEIPDPDPQGLAAEVENDPELRSALAGLEEIAGVQLEQLGKTILEAMSDDDAVAILTCWEGFARFCRASVGIEPTTLMKAFRIEPADPAADVLTIYPAAKPDEVKAAEWAESWSNRWRRRFE